MRVLGTSSSARIGRMVRDVVHETQAGGMTEIRMSADVLKGILDLRQFLFEAVYENPRATSEFEKAEGILGGLWEKVRKRPEQFLDASTIEAEGLDAAARRIRHEPPGQRVGPQREAALQRRPLQGAGLPGAL